MLLACALMYEDLRGIIGNAQHRQAKEFQDRVFDCHRAFSHSMS